MPFTLAHPAAAVPLRRHLGRFGVLSALVVGSMVPDVGYFVSVFEVSAGFTHSFVGLLVHGLPVGLVLYLLFHGVMKAPGLGLMPRWWRTRLAPCAQGATWLPPGASPWGVPLSILVGGATHIAWDAFTHADTPVVQALPVLRTVLFEVGGHPVVLFKLLQYLGGVAGLALLAWWTWRWARSADPAGMHGPGLMSRKARAVWWSLLAVLPPLMALRGTWIVVRGGGLPRIESVAVHFVVLDVKVLAGLFLLYSVGWQALRVLRGPRG